MASHAFVKKTKRRGRPKASAKCKKCGKTAANHNKRKNPHKGRGKKGHGKNGQVRLSPNERFDRFRSMLNQFDGARPWNLSPVFPQVASNPSHYPSLAALRACQAVARSNARTKKAVIRVIKRSKSKKHK